MEVSGSDVQGLAKMEEVLPQVSDTESNTRYKPVTVEDTDKFLANGQQKQKYHLHNQFWLENILWLV